MSSVTKKSGGDTCSESDTGGKQRKESNSVEALDKMMATMTDTALLGASSQSTGKYAPTIPGNLTPTTGVSGVLLTWAQALMLVLMSSRWKRTMPLRCKNVDQTLGPG